MDRKRLPKHISNIPNQGRNIKDINLSEKEDLTDLLKMSEKSFYEWYNEEDGIYDDM